MAYTPTTGSPSGPAPSSYRPTAPLGSAPAPSAAGGYKPTTAVPAQPADEGGFGLFDFLGNVGQEVGDMVQGITALGGAVVHDIGHTIGDLADFDPGEADYVLDDIAMALPKAIAQDYDSRYGISKFADGDIWGGLKAVLTGLYERPLSAIGDALMVGTGAKIAAKAGLAGETLGKSILGPGSMEAVSLTGAERLTTPLGLSQNPVARLAQRKLYGVLSYDAKGLTSRMNFLDPTQRPGADLPTYLRAQTQRSFAEETSLPVLRWNAGKAIEKHGVSKTLSLLGFQVGHRAHTASKAVRDIIVERLDLTPDEQDAAVSALMGTESAGLLDEAPSTASPAHYTPADDVPLPETVGELATPGLDAPTLSAASGEFGENLIAVKPDTGITSPHWRGTDLAQDQPSNVVVLLTDDMADAANMARRYAPNGSIEWRMNYAKATGTSYVPAVHFGIRSSTGQLHDVAVMTRDMFEQARAWSHTSKHVDALTAKVTAAETALAQATPETLAALTADVAKAQDELDAARAWNAHMADFSRRSMNGGEYNRVLQAADQLRYTIYNHATAGEIDHGLTYRAAWDRAFGAIRSERWAALMKNLETDLAKLLEARFAKGTPPAEIINPIIKAIESGLGENNPWTEATFRSKVDEIIQFQTADNLPVRLATGEKTILSDGNVVRRTRRRLNPETQEWDDVPVDAQAAQVAERITNVLRDITHEAMVENGEFPGLDWATLLREQELSTLPIPQYYPHIKASGATGDVVMAGQPGAKTIINSETARMKKWGGWLYERGAYERNPIKAYEALFQQIARHIEFRDTMMTLVQKYGREPSTEELNAWKFAKREEVLVSENGLKGMISDRTKLMSMTHEGVMAGKTLEKATMDAVETLTDQALESVARGMADDTIRALPRHVAEQMKRSQSLNNLIPGTFNFYYDTMAGLWKAQVLKLSPRWVVNNTLGNIIFMGIKNPGAIRDFIAQLMPRAEARARALFGDDIVESIHRGYMHAENYLPQNERLGRRADAAGSEFGRRLADSSIQNRASVRGLRKVADTIGNINTHIEDAARRGVFINAASRQHIRGVSGRFLSTRRRMEKMAADGIYGQGQWDTFINDVNATLGDYLSMSPVESQIIRRYLAPFWGFYRHTLKFLARMPFEHPAKMMVLQQVEEIDRQMNPFMPDYMRGSFEVGGVWARFGAGNPLEALTEGYWPAMANPMMGVAIQRATGTNPFGQKWYPPAGAVVETAGGDKYMVIRNSEGQVTGIRQFEGEWQPPLYESLTTAFMPQAGLLFDPWGRSVLKRVASPMTGLAFNDTYDPATEAYYAQKSYIEALKRAASSVPEG